MIRPVLAVVLALALVSVSLPAIEDARVDRTDGHLHREVDRLVDGVERLRLDDPGSTRALAPSLTVTVRLPRVSWTAAGVRWLRLAGDGPDGPSSIGYAVQGGAPVVRRLSVPLSTPDGGLVLRDPGVHRLRLSYRLRDGRSTLLVRRVTSVTTGPPGRPGPGAEVQVGERVHPDP